MLHIKNANVFYSEANILTEMQEKWRRLHFARLSKGTKKKKKFTQAIFFLIHSFFKEKDVKIITNSRFSYLTKNNYETAKTLYESRLQLLIRCRGN